MHSLRGRALPYGTGVPFWSLGRRSGKSAASEEPRTAAAERRLDDEEHHTACVEWSPKIVSLQGGGEEVAANPLVGTWKLDSWEFVAENGDRFYPLGGDAIGYIMYTEDGYMSVTVARPQRPRFASEDLLGASVDEKVAAADTYVTYCGRYEFQGDRVIHHVEASLFPNWVGDQIRHVRVVDDKLILSSALMLTKGCQGIHRLVWRRPA